MHSALEDYEHEAMAKLLTSLSPDGSTDLDTYNRLHSDMMSLATTADPWAITMETDDLVIMATKMNQSLDKLKQNVGHSVIFRLLEDFFYSEINMNVCQSAC